MEFVTSACLGVHRSKYFNGTTKGMAETRSKTKIIVRSGPICFRIKDVLKKRNKDMIKGKTFSLDFNLMANHIVIIHPRMLATKIVFFFIFLNVKNANKLNEVIERRDT